MTTHKVADLTGPLLDAAVAKAEGINTVLRATRFSDEDGIFQQPSTEHEFDPEGPANEFSTSAWKMWRHYRPSADWSVAGPIIDRELIVVIPFPYERGPGMSVGWHAAKDIYGALTGYTKVPDSMVPKKLFGSTPLIAAMRAYVFSKLGETVELP